jgi:hypothetical protein
MARRERGVNSRFVVVNAPRTCATKVLGHLFKHGEVKITRGGSKFAEGDDRIADVGATGNVRIQEFAKEAAKGEAMLVNQALMGIGVFGGSGGRIHGRDSVKRNWRLDLGVVVRFVRRWGGPTVGAEDAIDVTGTGQDNAVGKLVDVNAIEVIEEAKVTERWGGFTGELEFKSNKAINVDRDVFGRSSEGKVVNLS